MTRIVTTTYRYKRPPRKRNAQALQITGSAMIALRPPGGLWERLSLAWQGRLADRASRRHRTEMVRWSG